MRPHLNVPTDRLVRSSRFLGIVALTVLLMAGCGGSGNTPEDELRQWLEDAEIEAEDRNRRALLTRISDNYADARGNQKADIDNVLRYYFLRQKSVSLLTTINELQVYGDSAAEIDLTVGMAGTQGGINLSADVWNFEFELERVDGDWLLIGARWGELGGDIR